MKKFKCLKFFPQSLSNGVNDNTYEEDGGGDDFQKPKSNEKKDKKVKRAEEKRRQKEAKRAAAAAEAAQADYIPGATRPQQDQQLQVIVQMSGCFRFNWFFYLDI